MGCIPLGKATRATCSIISPTVSCSTFYSPTPQADHMRAVYEGGGLCDLENLRTLCGACHLRVTAEQVGPG